MLLMGDASRGKTSFAKCIANDLAVRLQTNVEPYYLFVGTVDSLREGHSKIGSLAQPKVKNTQSKHIVKVWMITGINKISFIAKDRRMDFYKKMCPSYSTTSPQDITYIKSAC